MKFSLVLTLLIAMPPLGAAQSGSAQAVIGPTQSATVQESNSEAPGPCISTGANAFQFSISCRGVSAKQGSEWLAILNRIAKDQLDPKLVMQKLDEIEIASRSPQPASPVAAAAPSAAPASPVATPAPVHTPLGATYTYEGIERTTRLGLRAPKSRDTAAKAFRRIKGAHEARQWERLASLCDQAIDEWPEWLTPVYFKAEAQANMGEMREAIALLSDVKRRAAGNPEYELLIPQADDLLTKIHRMGF